MDIDKPLDEIIAAKPRTRKTGRGGRRPAAGQTASNGVRARYTGAAPKSGTSVPPAKNIGVDASKIIISNLPQDVTEAAIRDLMQSTVGPVKSVQMSFNATGKSTGQATVLFRNKGDANKAHTAYHNRMIDNQRPMRVEIALDPTQMVSLASRVAPAPVARGTDTARGGRGGGRGRAPRRVKKSAEELDADMAAYKSTETA